MTRYQRGGIIFSAVWLVAGCSALGTRTSLAPVEERTALESSARPVVPVPRAAPAPQPQAQPRIQPEPEAVIVQPYVRETPITPQPLMLEVIPERQAAAAEPVDPTPVAVERPPERVPQRQAVLLPQPVERADPTSQAKPPSARVAAPSAAPASDGSAVGSLLASAQREQSSGNLTQAAATLERALRIEPRNARLWHELARVRLAQGQPGLAEALARKSSTLAGDDAGLRQRNNALISEAQSQGR